MNIVLDTNVLVAGLLMPAGPCGEIVRMVSSGELTLSFDARILSEYQEVLLRPKFRFREDDVIALLEYIRHSGTVVAASPLPHALPHADDEPFLQAAVAGRAACLVTGNRSHFPSKSCCGVKALSPQEFLNLYKSHKTKQ
jgi:putative PIN family toxin of toxin-antitoxin system